MTQHFRLDIRCGNSAFSEDYLGLECGRILQEVATKVALGETSIHLQDVNGNTVGLATFSLPVHDGCTVAD